MADLPSETDRSAVQASASPFHVRVDIPRSLDAPETWVHEAPMPAAGSCAVFVATTVADRGLGKDYVGNVQVRIWYRSAPSVPADLIFDQTSVLSRMYDTLGDFAARDSYTSVKPLSVDAERARFDLGGPFETEHALMVAINRVTQAAKNE